MNLELVRRRALVVGGSQGIGFAIAKQLRTEGASVVLASRNETNLAQAAAKLEGAESVVMDSGNENSIRRAVDKVLSGGCVDILVCNTGGPAAGDPSKISLEDWDKGYSALLRSTILLTDLVLPGMRERNWGRILTVTSTAALEFTPRLPVSSVFRSGLSAWTKALAKEVGRSGILVNTLMPGPTGTERLQHLAEESPAFFKVMETESALGRIAEPEEIGRAAAFLCSGANTFITGTGILVDGGFTRAF